MDIRFNSRRSIVYGRNGMVCTTQPLAAQAGLDVLRRGGNAVDAAVATAMSLTVTEPCSNGLGGDAFAILWYKGKMYGINSSGKSPKRISADIVRSLGYEKMPEVGPIPVNVPGIPGMWAALNERFGALPLTEVAKTPVAMAEEGYPVSPVIASLWADAEKKYAPYRNEPGFDEWRRAYLIDGRPPKAGEIMRLPELAKSLITVAETKAEDFYRGELAQRIADYITSLGGYLRADDMADFAPEWVEPISINYRGKDIWELPPNGQGIVALMALNILKGFAFTGRDERTVHLQTEAIKLAFADAQHYVTDPRHMGVTPGELLSEAYAADRRKRINESAQVPVHGDPRGANTVYLCTADREGNMVSFIESNYGGFGSGLVVPGTGVSLQNRGANFSLEKGHYNELAGAKRTYHTIIPGFVTENGAPVGPFGLMGGFMQPQGHVQILMNMLDFGMDIQEALNAPRWMWQKDKTLVIEPGYGEDMEKALLSRGHDVSIRPDCRGFGRGQIIFNTGLGSYMGATEPRADGVVAAY